MLAQESVFAPLVYRGRANTGLRGQFVAAAHAALAEVRKTALKLISIANDDDLLVGNRLPFPALVAHLIETFGGLPIRAGFEQFVDLRNDLRKRLANQRDGLGFVDL